MGAKTYGNRRKIHWSVETEYALDKIVIYKNQVPIYVENGETYREIPDKGRYKLRVEMGWGKQNLYRWNGRIQVTGGKIIALNPYSAEEAYWRLLRMNPTMLTVSMI